MGGKRLDGTPADPILSYRAPGVGRNKSQQIPAVELLQYAVTFVRRVVNLLCARTPEQDVIYLSF